MISIRFAARLGLGVAVVLLLVGGAYWYWLQVVVSSQKPVTLHPPGLQQRDCDFFSSYGLRVDCYWVPVGGAQARLSAAIFRGGSNAAPDPLVYLAGGPGETGNSAAESLAIWDHWLAGAAIGRDLVLLDLRGLSPSEPAWDCDEYTRASRRLLGENLTFAEEGEIIAPVLEKCLQAWRKELARQGGPVISIDEFSSQRNAEDLAAALRRLGYDRWNYLAVSYGTRLALLAAMQQPEVRRVILDSPYTLEHGSIADSVILWVEAFDRYWRGCEIASCTFSEEQFWQLMEDLRLRPVWVEVENWRTGRMEKWLLNDGRLAAAAYTSFYSSELTGMIASALQQFVEGDRQALTRMLEIFFNQAFDSRFNSALYWATECNDNPLGNEASFQQALAAAGRWQPYFSADWQYHICRAPSFRPGQLAVMKQVSTPILVAVGQLDPITTETHARELMQWLPGGYLLVQQGRSHAEFFMAACGQDLISWFLRASPEQLATEWQERTVDCQAAPGEAQMGVEEL